MKTTCSQCASFQFNLIYDTLFELGQSVLQSRHNDLSLQVSPVRVGVINACGVKCSGEALVSRAQITLNCYICLFSRIQQKKGCDWNTELELSLTGQIKTTHNSGCPGQFGTGCTPTGAWGLFECANI